MRNKFQFVLRYGWVCQTPREEVTHVCFWRSRRSQKTCIDLAIVTKDSCAVSPLMCHWHCGIIARVVRYFVRLCRLWKTCVNLTMLACKLLMCLGTSPLVHRYHHGRVIAHFVCHFQKSRHSWKIGKWFSRSLVVSWVIWHLDPNNFQTLNLNYKSYPRGMTKMFLFPINKYGTIVIPSKY